MFGYSAPSSTAYPVGNSLSKEMHVNKGCHRSTLQFAQSSLSERPAFILIFQPISWDAIRQVIYPRWHNKLLAKPRLKDPGILLFHKLFLCVVLPQDSIPVLKSQYRDLKNWILLMMPFLPSTFMVVFLLVSLVVLFTPAVFLDMLLAWYLTGKKTNPFSLTW